MAHRAGTRPRMIITAAGEDDTPPPAADDTAPAADPAPDPAPAPAVAASPHGRFHALIIEEGVMTNDGRIFTGLAPRNTPQWPLMADDGNHPEHLESVLIGNFDRMELIGTEWHGWGSYLIDPDENALRLINLVKSGELRGISADVEPTEYEILFPVAEPGEDVTFDETTGEPQFPDLPVENIDGKDYEVMSWDDPVMRVSEGFVMGATVLTWPAFAQAFIEDDSSADAASPVPLALAASGQVRKADIAGRPSADDLMRRAGCTGVIIAAALADAPAAPAAPAPGREASPSRFSFPDIPPAEWFEVPETPGPMPLTILDSGQVFGHLAVWGECHVGIAGECVEPPISMSNYARFHVGETPVAPRGRVSTGRLTFGTGHADTKLAAGPAAAHYDNSGTVAASLVASDGEYGIWVCGAMRSGLSAAQVREVMECPPSGDWRRFGRDLELVAALAVNVPGFNTVRDVVYASGADTGTDVTVGHAVQSAARVRKEDGLVASLIVSHPAPPITAGQITGKVDKILAAAIVRRIAASVGRTPSARREELRARVHGGRS